MSQAADRHLLFGLLALRTGLVRREQLLAAFQAWTVGKDRPIGDHLVALGSLDEAGRNVLESLVDLHVAAGGVAGTLAAIPIDAATLAGLSTLADVESDARLERIDEVATNADATRTFNGRAAAGPDGDHSADGRAAVADGPRFQVLRPHARGGLGAVYVALDSELNREVALKRIHEDRADDPVSRGRFLVEAQITGGLEHPGIVPVYGMGRYDDGRPYYAMRLVHGDSLRDAIEAFHKGPKSRLDRSLAFRRLLKNFTDVCNAVDYAHSRGVLHRDVKPTNVIVGKHGETLVVDWGAAKATGAAPTESAERPMSPPLVADCSATLPGQAMGTPAYMSPEQARGDLEAVGPRSDVYSLGATLHHLLTGRAPFEGTLHEVLKAVEAGDLRPPRAVDPTIDPALEAIVLKAMATDPKARYPSAKALAADVERWLADERVEAYREPWTRSLIRWLTRHRAGVTGLAAAGLAAFVGLAAVSTVQTAARRELDHKNFVLAGAYERLAEGNEKLAESNAKLAVQRKRAEENESRAIDAVKRFKDAIIDNPELKNDPKLESLRKALLKEPLSFFSRFRDRLRAANDDRPESLYRLADVACSHAWLVYQIGGLPDAIQAVGPAVEVFERLARDHPDVAKYQAGLAWSRYTRGFALRDAGRIDESQTDYERAVEIYEGLVRDHPDVADYQASLGRCRNWHGFLLRVAGRSDEARAAYQRAVEIFERLVRDHPDDAGYQESLASCLDDFAALLYYAGRIDQALAASDRGVEMRERLIGDRPETDKRRADLAWSRYVRGFVLRGAGRIDEAVAAFERAERIYEQLVRDQPAVVMYQQALAVVLDNHGLALQDARRNDEARRAHERAARIFEELLRARPEDPSNASMLGAALNSLAWLDLGASRFADARERLLKAVGLQKKALEANPKHPSYLQDLDRHLADLVRAEHGLGHGEELARVRRELVEFRLAHPGVAVVDARLKAVLGGETPRDDAERLALARQAYDALRFPVAARLWGEALDSDPKLGEDRRTQHPYNAACAAALAADGQGIDPPTDDAEKARLRGRALDWLKIEKALWSKLLESGRPDDRAAVVENLRHWREDPDLAAVRDPDSLAKLPEAERTAWKALWDDVAELIRDAA